MIAPTNAFRGGAFVLTAVPLRQVVSESTGIERRLRLLLDAAYAVNPNVHLAFLVEPHLSHAARDALREQARQNLAAMLGGPVTVTLIPLAPAVRNPTGLLRQLVGAASLYRQASIAPFVDAAPLASLASLLADAAPEFVIAQRLTCAAMLLRLDPAALPPVFFDLDDVEHVSHARAIRRPPYWRSKSLQYLHLPALMLGERRAIRLSRRAFVCSAADRERVRRDLAVDNVDIVPNAIVPPPRYVPPPAQPHLLFVGTYGYAPNRDAAEHLIDDIWPRIRARLPTATLTLAGAQSHLLKHARATPAGVVIAGFVTDLTALYERTAIVLCPVRSGSGTRVKIIEAALHGRAVVATTLGAEGLEFRADEEIVLRDDPAAFAEACLALLEDGAYCTRLGEKARDRAAGLYARDDIARRLTDAIVRELGNPASSVSRPPGAA